MSVNRSTTEHLPRGDDSDHDEAHEDAPLSNNYTGVRIRKSHKASIQLQQEDEEADDEEEEEEYDDVEEERRDDDDDDYDEYEGSPPPASSSSSHPLAWCATFLERDDHLQGANGEEDDDLVDLRREYGKPLSSAVELLPALQEKMSNNLESAETKLQQETASLLKSGDEEAEEDDWEMLGLQCDCACLSCRQTHVERSYPEFIEYEEDEQKRQSAEENDDENPECECLLFEQPDSLHVVLLDLFEDFFRFRVHLHRVTFATSINAIRSSTHHKSLAKQISDQQREALIEKQYIRCLALLKARARRDLKHMELLEAYANQLGWNQSDSPAYSPSLIFTEIASPGPSLLAGLIIEFLSYFLVHKTTCTNFDKAKISILCTNLIQFAIKTGDIDSAERAVTECLKVCDRSMLDLPIADLIETELFQYVQRCEEEATALKQKTLSPDEAMNAAREAQAVDADVFPSTSTRSSTARAHQVYRGYWILESFEKLPAHFLGNASVSATPASASARPPMNASAAKRTPMGVLVLTSALQTKSKMAVLKELETMELKKEKIEQHKKAEGAAGGSASASVNSALASLSIAPSLLPSTEVRVLVPMSVIDLLSEASDRGNGWQLNLELTRFEKDVLSIGQQSLESIDMEQRLEPFFRITRAGHVNCA